MDILRLTTGASVRTILPSVADRRMRSACRSPAATLFKRGNIILRTARFPKHDICLDRYMWVSGLADNKQLASPVTSAAQGT
jgi:hypothetical protein